jgi:trigger factor
VRVTTEELGRCEILMTIEAEPAQEQDLLKKAARRISRQVQIPGFRPGKAPYNTIVRRFGLKAIQQEALEHSIEKIIMDALEEAELEPSALLQLDEISWDPLTIKARVPGPPKVELGNYRDLRRQTKTIEVTDEDVDQALEALQEQNATWTPVERPAEVGDLITMSAVEKDGAEVLAENDAVEYELTPPPDEADDRPDLTTPLLGLGAGDNKTFTINYPETWQNERYAGKEITLEVEVSSVKAKELDPLDDDFAQSMRDIETLDELKEELRAEIQQRREDQYNHELGREVFDQIIEDAEIEWPQALEESRIDEEFENYKDQLEESNLTLDDYLNMQGKTAEALREEVREKVAKQLRMGLALQKLTELEKLAVSNVEILERARTISDLYGGDDRIWQAVMTSKNHQATVASNILTDKVFYRLAEIVKGEAPEPGEQAEADAAADDEPQASADEVKTEEEPAESDAIAASDEDVDNGSPAAVAGDESTEESVTEKA